MLKLMPLLTYNYFHMTKIIQVRNVRRVCNIKSIRSQVLRQGSWSWACDPEFLKVRKA